MSISCFFILKYLSGISKQPAEPNQTMLGCLEAPAIQEGEREREPSLKGHAFIVEAPGGVALPNEVGGRRQGGAQRGQQKHKMVEGHHRLHI